MRKRKRVSAEEIYWHWLREGWKYRAARNPNLESRRDEYRDRVLYESKMVVEKDFVSYFLMLSDVVRFAKDSGIVVGPARGSAAASLVCYLLRITEIDPLQFPTMLFERFLDPTRVDYPDVDLDFSDNRRHEVREHMVRRYGAERVGNIANFVGYHGKNSLDDVARVYEIPKYAIQPLKDLLLERSGGDSRIDSSIEDTADMFPAARAVLDKHPELLYALRLEGNERGMNVHAAGLVVSNRPINETCALITRQVNGHPITVVAYDKKAAEYLGMLKADILSLTTLGAMEYTLEKIGMTVDELYQIPLDDPMTIKAFGDNDVVGIFQFEGRATRSICGQVAPSEFMHLAHINALSRPGPLFSGMTAEYIAVRRGEKEPDKLHPIIDEMTRGTNGQILFQEQVLSTIREIGGFPVDRVHEIRRIISQKLGEMTFNKMEDEFIKGAAERHGIDAAMAKKIWNFMATSATYSFNIAHSISYAMLAYWQMWLKVNYPLEYFYGAMRKVPDDKKSREWQRPRMLRDARRHGIAILGPAVGLSKATWSIDPAHPNGLRGGYVQIPDVGEVASQRLEEAATDAPDAFQTWHDFTKLKGIGDKTAEKMRDFAALADPFELDKTSQIMDALYDALRKRGGPFRYVPKPTHRSAEIPTDRRAYVVWAGIIRRRQYKDYIEDERSKTNKSVEEIKAGMQDPELTKSCQLQCYDAGEDEVYVRTSRWTFPKFKAQLESIVEGESLVIVCGHTRGGQSIGAAINVQKLFIITAKERE